MTIDEAVQRIPLDQECFIVWRDDTGEVLKVEALGSAMPPSALGTCLTRMGRDLEIDAPLPPGVMIASRFFEPGKATREILEKQQDECLANQKRLAVLLDWQMRPAAQLVAVLASGQLPAPLKSDVDIHILLNALFDLHGDEIKSWHRRRLRRLADRHFWGQHNSQRVLWRLWELENNQSAFIDYWAKADAATRRVPEDVVAAVGRLRLCDPPIVHA